MTRKNKRSYTHETYGVHRFHIPNGMYSIEEIEKFLIDAKKIKEFKENYFNNFLDQVMK